MTMQQDSDQDRQDQRELDEALATRAAAVVGSSGR